MFHIFFPIKENGCTCMPYIYLNLVIRIVWYLNEFML